MHQRLRAVALELLSGLRREQLTAGLEAKMKFARFYIVSLEAARCYKQEGCVNEDDSNF